MFEVKYDEEKLSHGTFTVTMTTVNGEPTEDSPTKCVLGKPIEVTNCSSQSPGLEELVVYSRDSQENPTQGICTVVMEGPAGPVVDDVGDGTYKVLYDRLAPGDYTTDVMVNSQPIAKFSTTSKAPLRKDDTTTPTTEEPEEPKGKKPKGKKPKGKKT